jgi:hypothetical protein
MMASTQYFGPRFQWWIMHCVASTISHFATPFNSNIYVYKFGDACCESSKKLELFKFEFSSIVVP